MVRAIRGMAPEVVVWVTLKPRHRGEHPVNALHSWPSPFITPGEQPAVQVQLGQLQGVNHLMEAAHKTAVESIVTFILYLVNEVKVATYNPRPTARRRHPLKLQEKVLLKRVIGRPVDRSQPAGHHVCSINR